MDSTSPSAVLAACQGSRVAFPRALIRGMALRHVRVRHPLRMARGEGSRKSAGVHLSINQKINQKKDVPPPKGHPGVERRVCLGLSTRAASGRRLKPPDVRTLLIRSARTAYFFSDAWGGLSYNTPIRRANGLGRTYPGCCQPPALSAELGDHYRSDIDEELQPAKLIVPEDLK